MPTLTTASPSPDLSQAFRWTRQRYDQAVDAGVFTTDDKIELLEGEIVPKMSQNNPHRVATALTNEAVRLAFAGEGFVQVQSPIGLSPVSEPEPDVVVVLGSPRDFLADHPGPESILLLIEVSDSSLREDRTRKLRLYAEAGVVEYWIVNLRDRVLEVHLDPHTDGYTTRHVLRPDDSITPSQRSGATLLVSDLLP